MIVLLDVERIFSLNSTPIDKNSQQPGIERNFLKLIKGIQEKPITSTYW